MALTFTNVQEGSADNKSYNAYNLKLLFEKNWKVETIHTQQNN